ncbi:hypothetical protein [Wuhan nido-like virus 1]|uniref:hypothetical protein n=1 Tax=Wuhan nido-like virus 1 TaxID=1923743 RepID=UPI00090A5E06|nr:hypothetical protein [Wuhan nido-like virus 1]APG77327.1 hypothetical protein [Wuhan nido-like virus 1]
MNGNANMSANNQFGNRRSRSIQRSNGNNQQFPNQGQQNNNFRQQPKQGQSKPFQNPFNGNFQGYQPQQFNGNRGFSQNRSNSQTRFNQRQVSWNQQPWNQNQQNKNKVQRKIISVPSLYTTKEGRKPTISDQPFNIVVESNNTSRYTVSQYLFMALYFSIYGPIDGKSLSGKRIPVETNIDHVTKDRIENLYRGVISNLKTSKKRTEVTDDIPKRFDCLTVGNDWAKFNASDASANGSGEQSTSKSLWD